MWDGCGSSLCHISYQKNALRALTCMPSVSTSRREEMYLANGLWVFLVTAMRTTWYSFPCVTPNNTLYNTEEKDFNSCNTGL